MVNMGFKSAESKPKSYNRYVRKVEPGPGSFGTKALCEVLDALLLQDGVN